MGFFDYLDPADAVSTQFHAARDTVKQMLRTALGGPIDYLVADFTGKLEPLRPLAVRNQNNVIAWHAVDDNDLTSRQQIADAETQLQADITAALFNADGTLRTAPAANVDPGTLKTVADDLVIAGVAVVLVLVFIYAPRPRS